MAAVHPGGCKAYSISSRGSDSIGDRIALLGPQDLRPRAVSAKLLRRRRPADRARPRHGECSRQQQEADIMGTNETRIDKNLSRLEGQLALWSAKLEEVTARANVAGQKAKIESQKQIDELKSKLANARAKLDEAKAAGSEKWETIKDGVQHVWTDVEDTFKKLMH
jgi:hypothetical protein